MTEDKSKAFNAVVEEKMTPFGNHKQSLLAILRDAYEGGPQAAPFDEAKSWSRLERTAYLYFRQEGAKQEAMSNFDRETRQRAIGAALKKARNLIDEAMLDEAGDDLFSAWSEKANLPLASVERNDDGSFVMVRPADEMFKKAVACLTDLETAADRAAGEAHQGRGRPPGARVLPTGYIETLAAQYRDCTGVRPVPDRGRFVQYVCAFLAALGRANISEDYVVKLTREASSCASSHPDGSEPSPFSE